MSWSDKGRLSKDEAKWEAHSAAIHDLIARKWAATTAAEHDELQKKLVELLESPPRDAP